LINQNGDVKENEQNLTREEARQINEMCLQKLQRYCMKYFVTQRFKSEKFGLKIRHMLVHVAKTS